MAKPTKMSLKKTEGNDHNKTGKEITERRKSYLLKKGERTDVVLSSADGDKFEKEMVIVTMSPELLLEAH